MYMMQNVGHCMLSAAVTKPNQELQPSEARTAKTKSELFCNKKKASTALGAVQKPHKLFYVMFFIFIFYLTFI